MSQQPTLDADTTTYVYIVGVLCVGCLCRLMTGVLVGGRREGWRRREREREREREGEKEKEKEREREREREGGRSESVNK